MTDTLTIQTDRGPLSMPTGTTVEQALRQLVPDADKAAAMATAVNGQFVPRHDRDSVVLNDGDTLLCFAAITGG